MHGLCCSPRYGQLFCHFCPHLRLEPASCSVSKLWLLMHRTLHCTWRAPRAKVLSVTASLADRAERPGNRNSSKNSPLVEPGKLVLPLVIPFAASFEIVLVVEPTTDGTAARQPLGYIFPFHATPSEFDNESIFLRRPFALLFNRLIRQLRRHASSDVRH